MAFKKGTRNTKGRPRRAEPRERLRALGFDPLKELVDYALTLEKGTKERADMALELLPYQCPKLRSVAHTVGNDEGVTITIGGPKQTQLGGQQNGSVKLPNGVSETFANE